MSGSPVYINNKLIGAVSFGFDFSMEPICGVTPIADMLDALVHEESGNQEQQRFTPANISYAMPPNAVQAVSSASGGTTKVMSGSPRMVPLMSPVSLAGFSLRAEQYLSET